MASLILVIAWLAVLVYVAVTKPEDRQAHLLIAWVCLALAIGVELIP